LGLRLYLLGFLNKIDKGLDPCLGGRGQEALHFVNGKMIVQKLHDIRPELPARDDSSAGKGIVDGTTVSEWNLTPELRTVNYQQIIDFDHRPNIPPNSISRYLPVSRRPSPMKQPVS
jgi:hypothetical protein